MNEKVSRLRQLMAEAVPKPPSKTRTEEDAWASFQHFVANSAPAHALDNTARAQAARTINRIAMWYGPSATSVLTRWLDNANASGIAALDDDQIAALRDDMQRMEDCIQGGFGSPFAPPAD